MRLDSIQKRENNGALTGQIITKLKYLLTEVKVRIKT